jgi:hypothetical protein
MNAEHYLLMRLGCHVSQSVCSTLNWDEFSDVFQRTPNPGLTFWCREIISLWKVQKPLKLFADLSAIKTHCTLDKAIPLSELHIHHLRIFP